MTQTLPNSDTQSTPNRLQYNLNRSGLAKAWKSILDEVKGDEDKELAAHAALYWACRDLTTTPPFGTDTVTSVDSYDCRHEALVELVYLSGYTPGVNEDAPPDMAYYNTLLWGFIADSSDRDDPCF